ncbi:hypothetical protein GCM10009127_10330 [Alteraurantiacibacter aestuarii]
MAMLHEAASAIPAVKAIAFFIGLLPWLAIPALKLARIAACMPPPLMLRNAIGMAWEGAGMAGAGSPPIALK